MIRNAISLERSWQASPLLHYVVVLRDGAQTLPVCLAVKITTLKQ